MVYVKTNIILLESFSLIYDGKGLAKGKKVNVFELVYKGSPEECAIAISKKETELYQTLGLKDRVYTLFTGPMEYTNNELRVRIGLAVGVHRK